MTPEAKKKAAEAKSRGDDAFKTKDYNMAIDAYTQVRFTSSSVINANQFSSYVASYVLVPCSRQVYWITVGPIFLYREFKQATFDCSDYCLVTSVLDGETTDSICLRNTTT